MTSWQARMRQSGGAARGGGNRAAEPAPSSTVVVARPGKPLPEFLLVRRHARAQFGASHVFPGGLVEAQDGTARRHCRSPSAADATRRLGLEKGALDYYSAAIRELFEETGVLLAHDATGRLPATASGHDGEPYPAERLALLSRKLSWPGLLDRHGLTLSADRLTYFAWWITPTARPARFSTRFFLALLPDGQSARHDGHELTDSCWITAENALAAGRRGQLKLPPPTAATLRDLSGSAGLDDLQAWVDRRANAGVSPILPVIESRSGGERIVLPGDPDYPPDAGERP
jgi:8-oxo-dGTP pyrophosphatase MutT (NUDIX family)